MGKERENKTKKFCRIFLKFTKVGLKTSMKFEECIENLESLTHGISKSRLAKEHPVIVLKNQAILSNIKCRISRKIGWIGKRK
jgi:hypothetical protein